MVTTSLKLPDALKQRVNALAALANKSLHAFMVDAIAEQTESTEKYQKILAHAQESKREFDETGNAYDADEVNAYFRAKIQDIELPKPQSQKYK